MADEEESKDPETYAIIGAAMEVHREMGPGFLEAVYRHALTFEFVSRGIPYQGEIELPIHYQQFRIPTPIESTWCASEASSWSSQHRPSSAESAVPK